MRLRKIKMNKTGKRLILLAVIVAAGLALYANRSSFHFFSDGQKIFTMENGKNYQFFYYKDDILALNYDGVIAMNTSGDEEYTIIAPMAQPCADFSEDYALYYDREGHTVLTYKKDRLCMKYETEHPIISARVNSRGYAVLITQETGYNARIMVLDSHGAELYIWQVGEGYVLDADLSPDCRRLAALSVTTEEGVLYGNITVVDIQNEEVLNKHASQGQMPLYVRYIRDGSLIMVAEDGIAGYSSSGEERWTVSYENRLLHTFDVDYGGNCVVALGGNQNNTVVTMYTKNGEKTGEYTSDTEVLSLDANGRYIALSEQNRVSVINYKGKVQAARDSQRDIRRILLLSGRTTVVIGRSYVELMKL